MTIGNPTFDAVNDTAEENLDEMNDECIRNGLLIVGGLNRTARRRARWATSGAAPVVTLEVGTAAASSNVTQPGQFLVACAPVCPRGEEHASPGRCRGTGVQTNGE